MTTQQREEVNEVMVKQMNRMKARGQVDQGQVQELVKCTALRRVVEKWGGQVSEVGWAWIAEMKRRGDETVTRLERTYKGTMAIRHGWEECALARSGWDVELRRRYSDEELEEIERLQIRFIFYCNNQIYLGTKSSLIKLTKKNVFLHYEV